MYHLWLIANSYINNMGKVIELAGQPKPGVALIMRLAGLSAMWLASNIINTESDGINSEGVTAGLVSAYIEVT